MVRFTQNIEIFFNILTANSFLVLDQGRVVESGTHKQLLSMKGRYHELVQLQNIEEL